MSEFEFKNNFVKFLQTSLDTWGSEKNLEIVMNKETIQGLLKELQGVKKYE